MLKKILIASLISTLASILSCGSPLQTNSFSPMSLVGIEGQVLPSMISSVSPANASTGISINTTIRIQFALDMLSSSIDNTTITLSDSDNIIAGTVSYSSSTRTAIFTPLSSLSYSVTYTVTLTTSIYDSKNNPLPYTVHITFTSVDAGTVSAPEFSLMGGTYYDTQTTSVTCSESGVMISYTTDGTTPTRTNGTLVASGATITLTSPQTVKAMAYDPSESKNDSAVTSAQYYITAAPPVLTPTGATYNSDVTVGISSTTAGAVIYYTTDGSTPTTSSTIYSAPIPVMGHGTVITIRAVAIASGLDQSSVTTGTYRIMYNQAATPTFSPSGGTYPADQSVTLYSSTPAADIYYTTDGSAPTTSSNLYLGPLTVAGNNTTTTIRAMAVAAGYLNSPAAAAAYTISYPPAAGVQFNPEGGSFTTDQSVTLSCTTPGAVIYYTTDGSAPTTSSAEYSTGIPVSGNGADVTIRAIAVAPGYSASAVAQENYTINWLQVSTPTFDMPAGSYVSPLVVHITTGTTGATVHYSTNGVDWIDGDPFVSSATATISTAGPVTIQAYATAPMMTNSTYAARNYTIDVTPPAVISVMVDGMTAEGARDVEYQPAIQVAFDEDMEQTSVNTNVGSNICYGSLQVSYDDFVTCIPMASDPVTGDDRIFTIYPDGDLDSGTIYQLKVTSPARDKAGNITTGYATSAGFVTEVSGFTDTTFGGGSGFATTEVAPSGGYDDDAQSILVQPDGNILIAGSCDNVDLTGDYDYIMGRYQENGTLDTGFNGGGITYYDYGSGEYGYDIAMQSGGRIILAGTSTNGFHLAGFNSNGSKDTTFGTGGYTVTDVAQVEYGTSSSCEAYAMAVDSSDRIYLAGYAYSSLNLNDFALVRYEPDGNLDPTFGGNGIITVSFNPTRNEGALAVSIQTDGKIVVVGAADDGTKNNFAIARFDIYGNLEMSRVIDFGYNAGAESVALYPDGRILVAGHANSQIALARINSDGSVDATFNGDGNSDGMIMLPFLQAGYSDRAHAVALQKNGKILVAGISMASNYDIVVARFHANGSLDPSFGVGGANYFQIGTGNDLAYDMKLQPVDGRIVVAGNFYNGTNAFDMFVLRIK